MAIGKRSARKRPMRKRSMRKRPTRKRSMRKQSGGGSAVEEEEEESAVTDMYEFIYNVMADLPITVYFELGKRGEEPEQGNFDMGRALAILRKAKDELNATKNELNAITHDEKITAVSKAMGAIQNAHNIFRNSEDEARAQFKDGTHVMLKQIQQDLNAI